MVVVAGRAEQGAQGHHQQEGQSLYRRRPCVCTCTPAPSLPRPQHQSHRMHSPLRHRYQLLRGRKARFVPGWDTHGLPIELKVLQALPGEPCKQKDVRACMMGVG